jgi:hypothetical protein
MGDAAMDRVIGKPGAAPGSEVEVKTAAALYAVMDLMKAAKSAQNFNAVEACEFAIEALVATTTLARTIHPVAHDAASNIIPFPVRR